MTENRGSLPSRGAWVEINNYSASRGALNESLPSRGAWVEIEELYTAREVKAVAPLAGSVGRNLSE